MKTRPEDRKLYQELLVVASRAEPDCRSSFVSSTKSAREIAASFGGWAARASSSARHGAQQLIEVDSPGFRLRFDGAWMTASTAT